MDKIQKNQPEIYKITGNWGIQTNHLKKKFAQLTNADLKFEPGKDEEVIARIAARLNKTPQQVIHILKVG